MINYSIIIPHRNCPNLLIRCLNSIPKREDTEIIVVDDNSEPEVIDTITKFLDSDKTIKLICTKDGKGAGYARNIGLKIAIGQYIVFADSDDLFTFDFDSLLTDYANKTFDIVYFNFKAVLSDDVEKNNTKRNYRKSINFEQNEERLKNYLRFEFGPPWCKIVSRRLIVDNKICFDECMKHNDTMFSLKTGYFADNIILDKRIGYLNTYRDGSITTTKPKNKQAYVDTVLGVIFRYKFFSDEHGIKITKWCLHSVIELFIRRDKDMEIVMLALKKMNENNLLTRFIVTTPCYLAHRLCALFGVNTKYLF